LGYSERQKATRQLKKLRKRLLETESADEVASLKEQIHVADVDLNYTQYYPLSEIYVSLYPKKSPGDETTAEPAPRPAMWAEVEKCMEDGTLSQLRNRVSTTQALTAPKPLTLRPAKPKPKPEPQAAAPDTTGMNRRQRRSQMASTRDMFLGKTKHKSMAFEKNRAFGATQAARSHGDGDDSDGGFFEE